MGRATLPDEIDLEARIQIRCGLYCPVINLLKNFFGWKHIRPECKYRRILQAEVELYDAFKDLEKYEEEFPDGT